MFENIFSNPDDYKNYSFITNPSVLAHFDKH